MAYQNNRPAPNVYLRFGKDAEKTRIIDGEEQPMSQKARLFVVNNENVWIPISQIAHYAVEGETIALTIPGWLAEKNNLMDQIDPAWIEAGCPD